MNPLKIGDTVPEFTLLDQDGTEVHLSDYRGQSLLIYFYPKAMTPGCTLQACKLRDNMNIFKEKGLEILGISSDTPKKLLRFVEKEMLNFTLLADENHLVAEQFGVWGKKSFLGKTYNGIHRISFLINTRGQVEQIFNDFKTSNHHDIILSYLDKKH